MALIEWTEDLLVGIAEIDSQHHRLVDLANRISDDFKAGKSRQELIGLVTQLVDQSLLHFATEEKYFSEYHYPKALAHVEEHKRFAIEGKQIQARLLGSAGTPDVSVLQFVEKWVRDHIQVSDMDFARWAKEHGLN